MLILKLHLHKGHDKLSLKKIYI